jgi:hypothetical protein
MEVKFTKEKVICYGLIVAALLVFPITSILIHRYPSYSNIVITGQYVIHSMLLVILCFIKKEKVVIKIPLIIMSLILFISQLLSLIKALD